MERGKEIEVLLGEQELSEQLCLWTFLKVERVVPALMKLWRLFLHQGKRKVWIVVPAQTVIPDSSKTPRLQQDSSADRSTSRWHSVGQQKGLEPNAGSHWSSISNGLMWTQFCG